MYVDIHTHILPGFCDGAADQETALCMLRIASENKTVHMVATPHFIPGASLMPFQSIVDGCRKLQTLAEKDGLDLKIHPGCEVFISPELPDLFEDGFISTLSYSDYILIELPMMSIPPYTELVLYKLQLKGLKPILAHPERNWEIMNRPNMLKEMIERGILVQVNSGSLAGIHGRKVKRFARQLLTEGLVHFIASDAHSADIRNPDLRKTAVFMEKKCGKELADLLLRDNGLALLENRAVRTPKSIRKKGHIIYSLNKWRNGLYNS